MGWSKRHAGEGAGNHRDDPPRKSLVPPRSPLETRTGQFLGKVLQNKMFKYVLSFPGLPVPLWFPMVPGTRRPNPTIRLLLITILHPLQLGALVSASDADEAYRIPSIPGSDERYADVGGAPVNSSVLSNFGRSPFATPVSRPHTTQHPHYINGTPVNFSANDFPNKFCTFRGC